MFEKLVNEIVDLIRHDELLIDFASYPLRGKDVHAIILLKSDEAVLSGVEIVENVLETFSVKSEFYNSDGEKAYKGTIAELWGDAYNVLICERTILNVLSFMSSVATKTHRLLQKVDGKVKIAATRKTIPFAGELQKIAIIHGGGDTHRLNLSDCAMIKDNHIKIYGSVSKAIRQVRKNMSFTKKIECEAETEEMAMEACEVVADIVMLDNFAPDEAFKTAKRIKEMYPNVVIEVSGGVDPDKVDEYNCDWIDVISLGKLTSEVKYTDFSLEIE